MATKIGESVLIKSQSFNGDFVSKEIQEYPYLGLTIPFSARAIVEISVWRDLKILDGSINIGHKIVASAAAAVISVVALVEAVVRTIFSFVLIPLIYAGQEGNDLYKAFFEGTRINMQMMCAANISVLTFLSSALSGNGNKESIESFRDAFRGEYYDLIIDHKANIVTRKPRGLL